MKNEEDNTENSVSRRYRNIDGIKLDTMAILVLTYIENNSRVSKAGRCKGVVV